MKNPETREFIDFALHSLGMNLDQLADRLEYKILRRVYNGEFPLPAARKKHIADIIAHHRGETVLIEAKTHESRNETRTDTLKEDPAPYLTKTDSLLRMMSLQMLQEASARCLENPTSDKLAVLKDILAEYDRRAAAHPDAKKSSL